mgnify:CR=1 FL=1
MEKIQISLSTEFQLSESTSQKKLYIVDHLYSIIDKNSNKKNTKKSSYMYVYFSGLIIFFVYKKL